MDSIGRFAIVLAVGLATLLGPASGEAITRCTAKISAADGTISVSGTGVSGNLQWGAGSGSEANAFANETTCVQNGKAKGCQLGAPGTPTAVTPPELCRLWVRDDAAECSIYLKGCTPGARTAAPPPLDPRFGSNTSLAAGGPGVLQCTLGEVWLTAGSQASATPADGRIIPIAQNTQLYSLIQNAYGGDVTQNTFALPDLRAAAPNGLTYVICTSGLYPPSPP